MQAQKFNGTVYVSKYKEDIKSMNGSLKNDSSAKKDWGWEDREKNKKKDKKCPHLPGTLLRVYFPPETMINLLNIIEVVSPSGICLIIRVPLFEGPGKKVNLNSLLETIKQAGGSVEVLSES